MFLKIVLKSLQDRKGSVLLTLMAMTISIFVILGVEHIRQQTKKSFESTLSDTDLVIGSRSGSLNLLLYSVFRIGSPTNNINWNSFKTISRDSKVDWAIPLSLGDSHKGFPVLGTNSDYFKYFRYGQKKKLEFIAGKPFAQIFDVVIGSEIAKQLKYNIGDKIILSHGIHKQSLQKHDEYPFQIMGILKPTGTPVDRTVHIQLEGMEVIHVGWQNGVQVFKNKIPKEFLNSGIEPKSITAIFVGLKSKLTTFSFQRTINNFTDEPLLAILPGVALSELWQMMSLLEKSLLLVASLVFISACFGVSAVLLNSIRERKEEIRLLRIIGASPPFIFALIETETLVITVIATILATILLTATLIGAESYIVGNYGIQISHFMDVTSFLSVVATVLTLTLISGLVPGWAAYQESKS
ncbi:MAG: FtsX-like permease family protein [Burkholderiaceae bacterium]|nr:MAG: FtsX-like permease family protein [Burkholderiaceae bacterium]